LAKSDGAGFMTNLAGAIANGVGSVRRVFEAKQDTARDLVIASGAPDNSRRAPNQPGTAIHRGRLIYRLLRLERNKQ
jgi:hypothetical protein